jgi:hypothetical protein
LGQKTESILKDPKNAEPIGSESDNRFTRPKETGRNWVIKEEKPLMTQRTGENLGQKRKESSVDPIEQEESGSEIRKSHDRPKRP